MNTWILSLIICSASPADDGSYCQAKPVEVGISRNACLVARNGRQPVQAGTRLECTNDPALVATLRN